MMPPPKWEPAPYYGNAFDPGLWVFVKFDNERGRAWFEPAIDVTDHTGEAPPPVSRRRSYALAEMFPYYR